VSSIGEVSRMERGGLDGIRRPAGKSSAIEYGEEIQRSDFVGEWGTLAGREIGKECESAARLASNEQRQRWGLE
jgi:hypothetical protein